MNKEKEEMLNYLNKVSELAIIKLRKHDGYKSYEVVDVRYRGGIVCTNKETGEQIRLPHVDIIAADINNKKESTKLTYVGTEELDEKFLEKYEIEKPIKDKVGEKLEDNEEISLEELKKQQEKEEGTEKQEKEERKDESKEEKEEQKLTADKSGATSLDQEVDGRTLRNLIGLDADDAYIKPISASEAKRKYGIMVNTKDALEIIKYNGESRLADSSVVKQDVQEGNNSFNKDLNIKVDGSVEHESNTTSLELVNMPNHYISIGYDEMTTKKEIKFSKRSGREGHREPEKELLKEGASEYIDPDQRNMRRRNEEGIGEPDEILERHEAEKKAGCDDIRVEDIDNYESNDTNHINPDDKIEGTDITWRQFANMCEYKGDDAIEKVHKKFVDYAKKHKNMKNGDIIQNIEREEKKSEEKGIEEKYEGKVPWDTKH